MNSIPLIKGNTPQEINTSIIALKKALSELEAQDRLLQGTDKDVQNKIKQINELIEGINTHLGTVDSHLTTIDNQITALQPVDTVTSGNMHSVTSGAVYDALIALKTVSRGIKLLSTNAQLTSNGLTYTVTEKGIVKVNFCKIGQGYSLFLSRNDTVQDRFSFYQGNSDYNFGSLSCFVDVGDTIKIYSDGSYTSFYIQVIILQNLGIR